KGCCCTCKVIVALSHAVSCSDKDGAPWEKSARVRSAAAVALEHCLQSSCCATELPAFVPTETPQLDKKEGPKEGPKEGAKESVTPTGYVVPASAKPGPATLRDPNEPYSMKEYYSLVPRVAKSQIVTNARRALEIGRQIGFNNTAEVNPTDYASVGYTTTTSASNGSSGRSQNLWDAITGSSSEPAPQAMMPIVTQTMAPTMAPMPTITRTMVPAPSTSVAMPTKPSQLPVLRTMEAPLASSMPMPKIVESTTNPLGAKSTERLVPAKLEKITTTPVPLPLPAPKAPTMVPPAGKSAAKPAATVIPAPATAVAPKPTTQAVLVPLPPITPATTVTAPQVVRPVGSFPAEPVPVSPAGGMNAGVPNPFGYR
ncbi:MAG: hypothetical protein ACRCZF_23630, partial [Gemmataceae bacterium]